MRPMDKMKEVFYNKANKSGQGLRTADMMIGKENIL